jgi:hypothetical protein
MTLHKRILRLALSSALFLAPLSLWLPSKSPDAFTALVPQVLPHRALGDFDSDGRIDTALIQEGGRISVRLSSSSSAVRLEASVSSVVEADIDHDGDLDLVAATPTGEVLVWLNDGYGRFTLKAPSDARRLSSEPAVAWTVWLRPIAVGTKPSSPPAPIRIEVAVIATRIRAPTAESSRVPERPSLPALRAPPAQFA